MSKSTELPRGLTHIDESGQARMVDIGDKVKTARRAVARGTIRLSREALETVMGGHIKKGDVFSVARIAAISAAKRTHDLIPLCHHVSIDSIDIEFSPDSVESAIHIIAVVGVEAKTGAEMEALTAVSVACLTLYDMIKGIEKGAVITDIALAEKSGGKSGHWVSEKYRSR